MDDTDDLDVLDDTRFVSMPISRHRMQSLLIRIDEIGRDGEVLNTTRRFEGIDSPQDVVRAMEDHKRLTAENEALKARQITPDMQSIWDEYQAMISEAKRTDTIVYPEERDRLRRDLWAVFSRMMEDRA